MAKKKPPRKQLAAWEQQYEQSRKMFVEGSSGVDLRSVPPETLLAEALEAFIQIQAGMLNDAHIRPPEINQVMAVWAYTARLRLRVVSGCPGCAQARACPEHGEAGLWWQWFWDNHAEALRVTHVEINRRNQQD